MDSIGIALGAKFCLHLPECTFGSIRSLEDLHLELIAEFGVPCAEVLVSINISFGPNAHCVNPLMHSSQVGTRNRAYKYPDCWG